MKAWVVQEKYERRCTVVFAETRGKAHELATHTDCCEDVDWNDISVCRIPEMDSHYRGRNEADWYDTADRIELVKLGWECDDPDYDICAACAAKEYCGHWERLQEEWGLD